MKTIFHITGSELWEAGQIQGAYIHPSLHTEGFIHFSRPHQIGEVARRNFLGQEGLVLLVVNEDELIDIKYEESDLEKFPHLYRPLPTAAIKDSYKLPRIDMNFKLPEDFDLEEETLVRAAQSSDAPEIANVHVNSWLESYKGIIPDTYLESLPQTFRRRMINWRQSYGDDRHAFVAESKEYGVIGFILVGAARDSEYEGYGEVYAIYMLRKFHHQGIGRILLERGFKFLQKRGYQGCYCWVLKENPTVNFYLKSGGHIAKGQKTIYLGKDLSEIAIEWDSI